MPLLVKTRLWKPGMVGSQTIKSKGKRIVSFFLLGSFLLTSCAPAYTNPIDLTATAFTRKHAISPTVTQPAISEKTVKSAGSHVAPLQISTPSTPDPSQEKTAVKTPEITNTPLKVQKTSTITASNTPLPTAYPTEPPSTETPVPVTPTAKPSETFTFTPDSSSSEATPEGSNKSQKMVLYDTQAGDTLSNVAVRFGVPRFEITSPQEIPNVGLFNPKQLLVIPNHLKDTGPGGILMPDSEVVYSPSALDFDINKYVNDNGGFLSTYKEYLSSGWHTGAEVVERVAIENSINPRILLSLLEFRSHWVTGQPASPLEIEYPISHVAMPTQRLYHQLSWAVQQFSVGFYGWRAGILTTLTFPDGTTLRMAPELNAGTVAVQYLFSKIENKDEWGSALYSPGNLSELHEKMFGNPWLRAQTVEPL
ncbi:MAG: hypothetical protein WCG34_10415, partial [Leptolinea sp.]